ncbi:hypothetical protein K2X33_09850 [bacterium]|nr:hypothetical protein [bacterium]
MKTIAIFLVLLTYSPAHASCRRAALDTNCRVGSHCGSGRQTPILEQHSNATRTAVLAAFQARRSRLVVAHFGPRTTHWIIDRVLIVESHIVDEPGQRIGHVSIFIKPGAEPEQIRHACDFLRGSELAGKIRGRASEFANSTDAVLNGNPGIEILKRTPQNVKTGFLQEVVSADEGLSSTPHGPLARDYVMNNTLVISTHTPSPRDPTYVSLSLRSREEVDLQTTFRELQEGGLPAGHPIFSDQD